MNVRFFIALPVIFLAAVTVVYADSGTVTVVNHTDCLCSINPDHQSASCTATPGTGVTIYTFSQGQAPAGQPVLYGTILDGATGLAPILPGGQNNIPATTIWIFKNTSGAYTPSSYMATPKGTLYAISLVTKNFGQIAYPVTNSDCPAQFTPNTPFADSIS